MEYSNMSSLAVSAKTSKSAMDEVVLKNMPLGFRILVRWLPQLAHNPRKQDSWRGAIAIGIMDAVRTYQPEKGAWSTHCSSHLKHRIMEQWISEFGPVHKRQRAEVHWNIEYVWLDEAVCFMEDSTLDWTPEELHCSSKVEDEIDAHRATEALNDAIDCLDARTAFVVEEARHGRMLLDIGESLGLSRERTRQIFDRGVKQICRSVGVRYNGETMSKSAISRA